MPTTKKFCITFAGVVGSSKTPIAYFLSSKFNLPILNNDAIRSEVLEDLKKFDQEEYIKRRDERIQGCLEKNTSFIYDASVDREWKTYKELLIKFKYKWFIISLDLSKGLVKKLYKAKNYHESQERIDQLLSDHEIFLDQYNDEITLQISDQEFPSRLALSYETIHKLIES